MPMPELSSTTLGRFCRELAGGLDDVATLIEEWGITQEYFEYLQTTPAFVAEMQTVRAEMAELGNDAGFIYRMKSLMENLLPDFVQMVTDKTLPPTQRFEMIKWAAEMARLKEKPASKPDMQAGPRGPTVVFKFGAGLPVQSMEIHAGDAVEVQSPLRLPEPIDVTPEIDGWPT